jgi:hypothetical protein
MRNIYDTYASKVCAFFDFPQGIYDASKMSSAVMQLPFAEAHQVLDGSEIAKLPRLWLCNLMCSAISSMWLARLICHYFC